MSRYNAVSNIRSTRCTVQLKGGDFCDVERAPDMPFAICANHAIQLYRRVHATVTEVQEHPRDYPDIYATVIDGIREQTNTTLHRVYYVRVGPLIKIGMTRNLRQRISNYPPGSELLATEHGGEDVERRRLRQFCHLLAERKEWFHPGADLLEHIAALAKN